MINLGKLCKYPVSRQIPAKSLDTIISILPNISRNVALFSWPARHLRSTFEDNLNRKSVFRPIENVVGKSPTSGLRKSFYQAVARRKRDVAAGWHSFFHLPMCSESASGNL
jgi:hypothetical protein